MIVSQRCVRDADIVNVRAREGVGAQKRHKGTKKSLIEEYATVKES